MFVNFRKKMGIFQDFTLFLYNTYMEKIKLKIDILKYKITLFTTILGSGIYLLINKTRILETVNSDAFYFVLWVLLVYGVIGFVSNLFILNLEEKKI